MKTNTYLSEMLKKTLKSTFLVGFVIAMMVHFNHAFGQTINSIEIPGAVATGNGQSFDVQFYSSTNSNTNQNNYKEIKVNMTNTKGEYLVFDDSSASSNWEVVQG